MIIGCISIWASNEANKGFHITILNNARDNSPAFRRFQLLYVSNDRATRLILEASHFIESLLYPPPIDSITQIYRIKKVNHVTLQLAHQNLTQLVTVDSDKEGEFTINLSPSIMEETNVKMAMLQAIGQGMARVWIFDNCHNAPTSLINGLVEYISSSFASASAEVDSDSESEIFEDSFVCWKDENPKTVARFLSYYEGYRKGFIQRLNQAMSQSCNWHDRAVNDALGRPPHQELFISNLQDYSLELL